MRCGHCCVSAEPGKGDNMSLETFRKALEIAEDTDSYIVLGGGEPTVHPHFEIILLEAMTARIYSPLLVITNGKNKRRALMLAHLAKKDAIHAELSTDHYHEPIDPKVYQAFEGHYRDVTSHRGRPLLVGRYLEEVDLTFEEIPPDEECVCDDWVVEPDGTIRQCGCPDSPIVGNVHTGGLYPKYAHCSGMCYRSNEFANELADADET